MFVCRPILCIVFYVLPFRVINDDDDDDDDDGVKRPCSSLGRLRYTFVKITLHYISYLPKCLLCSCCSYNNSPL